MISIKSFQVYSIKVYGFCILLYNVWKIDYNCETSSQLHASLRHLFWAFGIRRFRILTRGFNWICWALVSLITDQTDQGHQQKKRSSVDHRRDEHDEGVAMLVCQDPTKQGWTRPTYNTDTQKCVPHASLCWRGEVCHHWIEQRLDTIPQATAEEENYHEHRGWQSKVKHESQGSA